MSWLLPCLGYCKGCYNECWEEGVFWNSVQFSRSVVSGSLQPHESQHTRHRCPSPTPRVYSNSCPSSRRCHPAISSSVVPFSFRPQSLPASGSSNFKISCFNLAYQPIHLFFSYKLQNQLFIYTLCLLLSGGNPQGLVLSLSYPNFVILQSLE